jgi:hypothetical protein
MYALSARLSGISLFFWKQLGLLKESSRDIPRQLIHFQVLITLSIRHFMSLFDKVQIHPLSGCGSPLTDHRPPFTVHRSPTSASGPSEGSGVAIRKNKTAKTGTKSKKVVLSKSSSSIPLHILNVSFGGTSTRRTGRFGDFNRHSNNSAAARPTSTAWMSMLSRRGSSMCSWDSSFAHPIRRQSTTGFRPDSSSAR